MRGYKIMVYRFTIKSDAEETTVKGKTLLANHAVFFESSKDLEKEYAKDEVLAVKPIDYELPECDLFGDKIVIHKG